jgi:hypothetical protein
MSEKQTNKENEMRYQKIFLIIGALCVLWNYASAQTKKAPAEVAAAMLVKVAAFEKGLSGGEVISIYVWGDAGVAAELQKGIGQLIGKSSLKSVESGNGLPTQKPSILFVGAAPNVDAALQYSHANKILSATGNPNLINKGITLGFGIGDDNKPKIFLNLNGSVQEGLEWNPAIMKIAKLVQ